MNVFSFTGNLGRDAETRQAGDSTVTGFSVAVKSGWGDRERTVWVDVSVWGKRGEAIEPYLKKGGQVAVTGELSTHEHKGKTYLKVRANDVTLLGGKSDQAKPSEEKPLEERAFEDDSIPF